jgi:methionine sulfoxide reductase heme-binding subunit
VNVAAATLSPSAYWYLTRGTGTVALVLLTASVILGIVGSMRFSSSRWPRFAIDSVHRDVSLLVVVFLVIHVVTTVLDGFAPINLLDGLIPFVSPYRPLWLGLGTLSFDLILALVITSLARRRLGYRSWRAIHWLAYVSWPIAILHTLGTGTDVKQWWLLLLTVACILAVLAAVVVRLGAADRTRGSLRAGAYALSVITPIGIVAFALAGPLQHGWARRAGTPTDLLGAGAAAAFSQASAATTQKQHPTSTALRGPFSASLSGKVSQKTADGGVIVQLELQLAGAVKGLLRIRMGGQPLPGGGLTLVGSQVSMSAVGTPAAFEGRIVNLEGDRFAARVADSNGAVLNLNANLNIDQQNDTVTGSLSGSPAGGGG